MKSGIIPTGDGQHRHGNKIISRRTMKSILGAVDMDSDGFRTL